MTVTVSNIILPKFAEASNAAQYTSDKVKTLIDKFTVTNVSASSQTISIHIVNSGGSASDANVVVKSKALFSGQTYSCPELIGHVLEDGAFISTIASATSALSIRASGRVVS